MFSTKARVPRDYRANPVAGPGGAEAALAAYGDAPGLELLEMFVGAALLTASPGHCPAPKALQKQQSALSSDSSRCAVKIGRNEGTPIQHIVDIL
jgi:hypothetical protein